jgi:hypothetical protein
MRLTGGLGMTVDDHVDRPSGAATISLVFLVTKIHQEIRIMKLVGTLSTALVMGILLATLSGCQKKEGPVEQAGKSVDQATEKVGEKIEKAGENIQDAAKGDDK